MAPPNQCTDTLDAVQDTVLMGVQVTGSVVKDLDVILKRALQSPELQNAIKSTLEELARKKLGEMPVQFSEEDSKKLLGEIARKGADAAAESIKGQIQRTPQYQELERRAQKILDALKCSPAGVWFDQNKMILYILGGGLVVGGAAAMYVARAGDPVTEPLTSLIKDKKIRIPIPGNLELSASGFKFVPSKREVEVDLGLSGQWKTVKADFKVNVQAVDSSVQASASGTVVIPFRLGLIRAEGGFDARNPQVAPLRLGLGLEMKPGGGVRLDLMGSVQFRGAEVTGGSVALNARLNQLPLLKGTSVTPAWNNSIDSKGVFQSLLTIQGQF
jgi:hypothetical protein